MSPFHFLQNEELAAILNYVRKQFGKNASSVSIAEIQKVRTETKP
jgi:hypothetical protein